MDRGRKRPGPPSRSQQPAGAADKGGPDEMWLWAERTARERDGERSRDRALDDEAAARLKLLQKAAANFAARLPSAEEWTTFLREEIVPVFNAIVANGRMCVECGARLTAGRRSAASVCSPACASRLEARRKPRRGAGGPATEPPDGGDTAKISLGDLAALGRGDKDRKRPR